MGKNAIIHAVIRLSLILTLVVLPALPGHESPVRAAAGPEALSAGAILRVTTTGAAALGCGGSWSSPCSLLFGLATATAGDQLWVAAGTYRPALAGQRTVSFQLKEGVAVYGGFAGTETALDQRNWTTNVVTLSGDLNSNGRDDSDSYHVVRGANGALLDGVTISGGNANGPFFPHESGGGMFNFNASPTLNQVIFSSNYAFSGGGLCNDTQSHPVLTHLTFANNSAENGGGMYNSESSPIMAEIIFMGNDAALGGGIYNNEGSAPALTGAFFTGNMAFMGGGIYNDTSVLSLTRAIFTGNSSTEDGYGGGVYNHFSDSTLTDSVFTQNSANYGGAIYNHHSSPWLTNLRITGNTATLYGGGISNAAESQPVLKNVLISGNTAGTGGGGMYSSLSSPFFTQVTLSGNSALHGSGVYNHYGSQTVSNSILWDNPGDEIHNENSSASVTFSIVEGGYTGDGNLNVNPQFVTPVPAGPTTGGDLHLQDSSPAINAGNTSLVTTASDLDGRPRVIDGVVDMGAYETGMAVLYVDGSAAAGTGDGLSWANAFTSLSQGLAVARSGDQVWVAAGVYKPGPAGARGVTFQLKEEVAVYGGFAGTETALNQRNWSTNAVILSGDLNGNGRDNLDSYHVVTGATGAVLDGVTIMGGNASAASSPNNSGGGLLNLDSSPALANITFSGNAAASRGGGMFNQGSSPVLTNVTFSGNSAPYGGAMHNAGGGPQVIHATFSGNSATRGGAIDNVSSSVQVNNSILWGNTGGEISSSGGTTTVRYSTVQGGYEGTGNLNADPLLAPLGSYGGAMQTLALLPGSPAIDAGSASNCPLVDQRGVTRSQPVCDMGAYESRGFILVKASGDNQSAITLSAFPLPLVVSVAAQAAGEPVNGGRITFTAPASGPSAALTGSPAAITGGAASVTASANGTLGTFNVTASAAGANSVSFTLSNKMLAQVTLGSLEHVYDGAPKAASVTTNPPGLDVIFTYDGGPALPVLAGSYLVTATTDDPLYLGSTSGTLTIHKAETSASLALTASSLTYSQPVTLTLTVGVVPPGGGAPTGSVIFLDGSAVLGTVGLQSSEHGLRAVLRVDDLPAGVHTLSAEYTGDANFNPSSDSAALTIAKAGTTTSLELPTGPVSSSQPVDLVVVISPAAPLGGTPTGSVTFKEGDTVLGSAALVSGENGTRAVFTLLHLAAGDHTLTAEYSGDGNFLPSAASGTLGVTASDYNLFLPLLQK